MQMTFFDDLSPVVIPLLLLFSSQLPQNNGLKIALFASNGPYSHDLMMREVGAQLENYIQGTDEHDQGDRPLSNYLRTSSRSLKDGSENISRQESIPARSHEIHWIQLYQHNFGQGPIALPAKWKRESLLWDSSRDAEARMLMEEGGRVLWETIIPLDLDRPWDWRGAVVLKRIMQRNQRLCREFVQSTAYRDYLRKHSGHLDLVVVDHFIQECFALAASLLNASAIVQYSNWPVSDGYITSHNVPAPPSAYAKTGTWHPTGGASWRGSMDFITRVRNTLFHALIESVRVLQAWIIDGFYASIGHPEVRLSDGESKHLFYAARSELLVEPIRPISNRIKHFGCSSCLFPQDYAIARPTVMTNYSSQRGNSHHSGVSTTFITASLASPSACCNSDLTSRVQNCSKNSTARPLSSPYVSCSLREWQEKTPSSPPPSLGPPFPRPLPAANSECSLTAPHRRYLATQSAYPKLDLRLLDQRRFILVSFGSIAKVEYMPRALLEKMLNAFALASDYLIIWQTNSKPAVINQAIATFESSSSPSSSSAARPQSDHNRMTKSLKNLVLLEWAPLKILMAHKNLHYVIIHGGINTVNEVLMFGVPVLGVPLQGDQPSNLNRLVELGMGQLIDVKGIGRGELAAKMLEMERNYDGYRLRAKKVAEMIRHHRYALFHGAQKERSSANGKGVVNEHGSGNNLQGFWLSWALQHGRKVRQARFFDLNGYRGFVDYFAVKELLSFLSVSLLLVWVISR